MRRFTLKRDESAEDGVFGVMEDEQGMPFAYTLERSYIVPNGYRAKLPAGEYVLTKGPHQLQKGAPFMAYAFPPFMGWDGDEHTGVLIHAGNVMDDSNGCVLIGSFRGTLDNERAVLSSRIAFARFMEWAHDDQITVTVEEP